MTGLSRLSLSVSQLKAQRGTRDKLSLRLLPKDSTVSRKELLKISGFSKEHCQIQMIRRVSLIFDKPGNGKDEPQKNPVLERV